MKKIIDGLRYSTGNAIKIGQYSSSLWAGDLHSWTATLYKTPRAGRFFLHGAGGPLTCFARHFRYGEKIIPISRYQAEAWAAQYLEPKVFEQHFSEAIQEA